MAARMPGTFCIVNRLDCLLARISWDLVVSPSEILTNKMSEKTSAFPHPKCSQYLLVAFAVLANAKNALLCFLW